MLATLTYQAILRYQYTSETITKGRNLIADQDDFELVL